MFICIEILVGVAHRATRRKNIVFAEYGAGRTVCAPYDYPIYTPSCCLSASCKTCEKFIPLFSAIVFNHDGIESVFLTALLS